MPPQPKPKDPKADRQNSKEHHGPLPDAILPLVNRLTRGQLREGSQVIFLEKQPMNAVDS